MIIAVTLYTKKASYFHIIDQETLKVIENLNKTAVVLEEAKGLNGTCRVRIIEFSKGALCFDNGEEIMAARLYLDEPTEGHTREEVMNILDMTHPSVIPSYVDEEEAPRDRLEKAASNQKIVLMRHSLHNNDSITSEGQELTRQKAYELKGKNLKIVCTPAPRCIRTAELAAVVLGTTVMTASKQEIIKMVANNPETDWLIVTHQPTIEEWSYDLGCRFSPEMGEFIIL